MLGSTLCNPWTAGFPVLHYLRVYSNSCPLSRWCYRSNSSSVALLCYCLQSFPASGSFPMSWLFESGGQSTWSFSFSIDPFSEYSGLISFRIDCFDFLGVQGVLTHLLQHHNSKASVLWCSAIFMAQCSHPYTTTGKTIVLTTQTFELSGKKILMRAQRV